MSRLSGGGGGFGGGCSGDEKLMTRLELRTLMPLARPTLVVAKPVDRLRWGQPRRVKPQQAERYQGLAVGGH